MIVFSREMGYSIVINTPEFNSLITVRRIDCKNGDIDFIVNRNDRTVSQVVRLTRGQRFQMADEIEICLVDVQNDKCRLGIVSPPNIFISRFELTDPQNDDDGGATAPVPRPSSPKPPAFTVQLKEPETSDD